MPSNVMLPLTSLPELLAEPPLVVVLLLLLLEPPQPAASSASGTTSAMRAAPRSTRFFTLQLLSFLFRHRCPCPSPGRRNAAHACRPRRPRRCRFARVTAPRSGRRASSCPRAAAGRDPRPYPLRAHAPRR